MIAGYLFLVLMFVVLPVMAYKSRNVTLGHIANRYPIYLLLTIQQFVLALVAAAVFYFSGLQALLLESLTPARLFYTLGVVAFGMVMQPIESYFFPKKNSFVQNLFISHHFKDNLLVPMVFLIGAISEEWVYRATLFLFMERLGAPWWLSAFFCAIGFGLAHFTQRISGVIFSAALGLSFQWLFYATGALVYPMVAHFIINVLVVVMARTETKKGRVER